MTYSSEVLADSPLLYWKLDDALGSTSAADASGNSRTGTVTNWTFGQPAQVNGSGHGTLAGNSGKIVSASTIAFGTSQVTVEAWINFTGLLSSAAYMLWSFGTNYLDVIIQSGNMGFNTGAGDGYGCAVPTSGLHHIVCVMPNNQATTNGKIYIDGTLQTLSGTSGTAPNLGTCTIQISSWQAGGQFIPQGVYVDEFAVYSGALSATRITAHYNAGLPNPDLFVNALDLLAFSGKAFATGSYGTETSEPLTCPTAATAWYRYTPPCSAIYQIDTIGSSFDTGLSVYTGTSLSNLIRVAYDDDSGGSSTSRLALELIGGTQYYIQAGSGPSSGGATGNLKVNLTGQSRYNGWGSGAPSSSANGTNQINAGTAFYTSLSGQYCTGVRVFIQSAATGDTSGAIAYLYALGVGGYPSGSPLAQAYFNPLTKNAWNEVSFPTAYLLTANTVYYVVVYLKANMYFTLVSQFTGLLPAPSGASGLFFAGDTTAHHNGVFADNTSPGTLPNSNFSAEWFGVDPILAGPVPTIGWGQRGVL